jgi:membrane protein YdbS with pleckstrin-like domain
MIPLTRLQHVDLKRGPLDRRYDVASLEVHTAGTAQASHEIPCLSAEVGVALREQLIAAAELDRA